MPENPNEHREQARPPVRLYLQLTPIGIAAYERDPREVHDNGKPVYEYVPASALSSRDAEVREVLEGLSKVLTFEHGPSQRCWCSAWVHTPACRAARDLYSKLQVAELQPEKSPR